MKTRQPYQKRGIETKEKIMKAGIELFAKQGYYNINSKVIAKAAKVSIGSFYAYFKDKKELFIEILREFKKLKFQVVYECNDTNHVDEKKMSQTEIFQMNIKAFVNNLIESSMKYPTQFHIEVLQLSYRDRDINEEYNIYCKEEIKYLYEVFSSFPIPFTKDQLLHLAIVIQKIIDSYMLMILREKDNSIKDSLIMSLEKSIYYIVEEQVENCHL